MASITLFTPWFKGRWISLFDKPGPNCNVLIPFAVNMTQHKRKQPDQGFLKILSHLQSRTTIRNCPYLRCFNGYGAIIAISDISTRKCSCTTSLIGIDIRTLGNTDCRLSGFMAELFIWGTKFLTLVRLNDIFESVSIFYTYIFVENVCKNSLWADLIT